MGDVPANRKKNPRLIVRLAIFLMSHSTVVSVLCFVSGIVALLILPILAKNTYISENALMPGSANPTFSIQHVAEANKLVLEIMRLKSNLGGWAKEFPRLMIEHMEDLGADVYYHRFQSQIDEFHPLGFFSDTCDNTIVATNETCASTGHNLVGILRAPHGDGKEAIVLVTPYKLGEIQLSEALSLGLGYSIFSLLSRVTWLAKDIVWLVSDSQHGEYPSVGSWLRDYHNPSFLNGPNQEDLETSNLFAGKGSEIFKRAGTMAAAIVFKVVDKWEDAEKDTVTLYAEASNGQMPNLDLINIVNHLAAHRQGFRVKVASMHSLLNSWWLKILGEFFERLSVMAQSLNSQWKFGIPAMDYVEGTATLASSMYSQALGVPTGSHGAFRDYQIDAITLEMSPSVLLNKDSGQFQFILRGGRLLEGVIRSVNNLLEKFHQSFFLYLLTSPGKFVSVGVYMIALALLIAPLPIVAAALYTDGSKTDQKSEGSTASSKNSSELGLPKFSSWRWLHAAKLVFMVHLWAVIVSLLPSIIYKLPGRTPTTSMITWVFLSIFTLLVAYRIFGFPCKATCSTDPSPPHDWIILKALMIAAASIGLGLMSIINFATAQIGALLAVPLCLIAHPWRYTLGRKSWMAVPSLACNLLLAVVAFPPVTLLMLEGLLKGFSGVSIGDFWEWTESLWMWNSATYLYMVLVHLPCWVLFMHILMHPVQV